MNRDELASGNWEKTVEATVCICEVHGEVRKTAGCSSALRAGALTANLTDARKVAGVRYRPRSMLINDLLHTLARQVECLASWVAMTELPAACALPLSSLL